MIKKKLLLSWVHIGSHIIKLALLRTCKDSSGLIAKIDNRSYLLEVKKFIVKLQIFKI